MAFLIGIISDTHGLLRPEVFLRLSGVNHILSLITRGRAPKIVRDIVP